MTVGNSNFGDLCWPGIKSIWGHSYKKWGKIYPKFCDVQDSDKAFEKFQSVTGFGLAAVKDQGKAASYADPLQGFQQQIEHVAYALGSSITREMWRDDQYNFIKKVPSLLARSLAETEEVVAHGLLNNAFNAAFPGADGVSLCHAAHPLVDGSGSYQNTPTVGADLTQTALENAEIAISQFVDDRGLKQNYEGKTLVVSTQDRWVAEKILETEYEVGTANNTRNPIKGRYGLVVTPYLTDLDSWFLMTNCEDDGLLFLNRDPEEIMRDKEFDTLNLKFMTYKRFGVGFINGRKIYGSPGA